MWYNSRAVWTGGMSPCRVQGVRAWGLRRRGGLRPEARAVHGCATQKGDAILVAIVIIIVGIADH